MADRVAVTSRAYYSVAPPPSHPCQQLGKPQRGQGPRGQPGSKGPEHRPEPAGTLRQGLLGRVWSHMAIPGNSSGVGDSLPPLPQPLPSVPQEITHL